MVTATATTNASSRAPAAPLPIRVRRRRRFPLVWGLLMSFRPLPVRQGLALDRLPVELDRGRCVLVGVVAGRGGGRNAAIREGDREAITVRLVHCVAPE